MVGYYTTYNNRWICTFYYLRLFKEAFYDQYFPVFQQDDMTVREYIEHFSKLVRFSPSIIDSDMEKHCTLRMVYNLS